MIEIIPRAGNVFFGLFNGKLPFQQAAVFFNKNQTKNTDGLKNLRDSLNLTNPAIYEMVLFPKLILSRPALWRLFNEPDANHWSYKLVLPKTKLEGGVFDSIPGKEFSINISDNYFPIIPEIKILLNKISKTATISRGANSVSTKFKLFSNNIVELEACDIFTLSGRIVLTGGFNQIYNLTLNYYPKKIPFAAIYNKIKNLKSLPEILSRAGLFDYFTFSNSLEDKIAAALAAVGLMNPALHKE